MNKVVVQCVVCGKQMLLFPSIAKQKRTCSRECAVKRVPRVIVKCLVCGKDISLPPSLAATRKTCSYKCDAELRKTTMRKFFPKKRNCEICGAEFFTRNKGNGGRFCSQECISKRAADRINIDRECKVCGKTFHRKRSGKYCSSVCSNRLLSLGRKEVRCPVCNLIFITTIRRKKTKIYCSHKCQYKAQSLGLIKSYCRGNYGYRPDLGKTFRSSLEANFARVCQLNGWKWKHEGKCFETPIGFYTPDFWIEDWNSFVELRGYKGRSLVKPMMAAEQYGFKLRVIYENEFKKEWGHLRDRIPSWEDSRGPVFNMVDPKVYDERICKCGKKFLHRKSLTTVGVYCSRLCANKYKWSRPHSTGRHRKTISKICSQCGEHFLTCEDREYCSLRCYWSSMKGKHRCRQ